jgi:hypothetical protein
MSLEHSPLRQRRTVRRSATPDQLLYTRQQTARVLGDISLSTILRLERQGQLKKIRLMRGASAQVFHSAENVNALVAERIAEASLALGNAPAEGGER